MPLFVIQIESEILNFHSLIHIFSFLFIFLSCLEIKSNILSQAKKVAMPGWQKGHKRRKTKHTQEKVRGYKLGRMTKSVLRSLDAGRPHGQQY